MKTSFIKKIISIKELENVFADLKELIGNDNFGHALDLNIDSDLLLSCLSHESLLIWNYHVWSHFNGEKWDGIFIGTIRKSEKYNVKVMDEYLWMSYNLNSGINLYSNAYAYAKQQNCEYISLSLVDSHPKSNKLRSFYKKMGFEKDTEIFIKKINNP